MTVQENYNYCIQELKNIPYKDECGRVYKFTLSDLFKGYVWKNMSLSERKALGIMFFEWAKGEGKDLVKPEGKTAQKQQLYVRK